MPLLTTLYRRGGKRALDVVLSGTACVALSPVLIGVGVAVARKLGRPVLFKQERPGQDGKLFTLMKFRTMTDERDEHGALLPDDVRLTPFGQWLRSTSLDELPELLNVLKGEMSLVGPRPLLVRYLERYSEEQARRHDVRPGITGWAQVNGRNALSWAEKFALDVEYVDDHDLWLDLRILLLTLKQVVVKDGISADGHATMPEFLGTESPAAFSETAS